MTWSSGLGRKIAAALIAATALFGTVATGGALLIATGGTAHAQGCEDPAACDPDDPGGLGLPDPPSLPGDDGNPVPGGSDETVYQAVMGGTLLAGGAVVESCSTCLTGEKAGFIGMGGTVTFNVSVHEAGTYDVIVVYCDASATGRQAYITVDGNPQPPLLSFTPTGNWQQIGDVIVPVGLHAGYNTIEFSNPTAYAPDFSEIVVPNTPN
jgi:hypothetical protein